jgi:hypothetical protein
MVTSMIKIRLSEQIGVGVRSGGKKVVGVTVGCSSVGVGTEDGTDDGAGIFLPAQAVKNTLI